jgi:hypothetical protein
MKKVVDLMTYKIEKAIKENGFTIKKDSSRNVKILIKVKSKER